MFDDAVEQGAKVKDIEKGIDPVLWSDPNPELYILTENYRSSKQVNVIRKTIYASIDKKIPLCILSCIPYKEKETRLGRNPKEYYFTHGHSDITKYIPRYSKVVVEGRAINYLTRGELSTAYDFYDIVFNEPYFFCPQLRTNVYPIDTFSLWIKDDFPRFFAKRQFKSAYEQEIRRVRWQLPEYEAIEDVYNFYDKFKDADYVAIDTETDSLDWYTARLGCVTLAFDTKKGYYISWDKINPIEFGEFIKPKFKIYQNGQFDTKVLRRNGVPEDTLWIDYDTVQGAQICNEMSGNALKSQAWVYAKMGGYEWPLEDYKRKYKKFESYLEIPEDILMPYASYDPVATFRAYEKQNQIINWIDENFPREKDQSYYKVPLVNTLKEYLYTYVIPGVNAVNDVEYNGIHFDMSVLEEEDKKFTKEIEKQRKKVFESFSDMPKELNIDSGPQLSKYLAENGYPAIKKGKSGDYSVGINEIGEYVNRGYKEFEEFKKYRRLQHLHATFIEGYKPYVRQMEDGSYRINSQIHAFLKLSGRNGSSRINTQQVVHHGDDDYAPRIRRMFKPPSPDYYIAELDGKGYQLRIGAAVADDDVMRQAFSDPKIGGDLHSVTTQAIFKPDLTIEEILNLKKSGDNEISELRHKGKQANLSLEFGSSGFAFALNTISTSWTIEEANDYIRKNGLSKKLSYLYRKAQEEGKSDITREFCKYWAVANDIRKKFFNRYKGLHDWTERFSKFGENRGYVRCVHGAFRRLPQLLYIGKDTDTGKLKNWRNITLNSPIQNFENVNITGRLFYGLWKFFRDNNLQSLVAMTVHDSVVIYLHKDEIDVVWDKAKEIFEHDYPENNGVKMELEAKLADWYGKEETWGEGVEL